MTRKKLNFKTQFSETISIFSLLWFCRAIVSCRHSALDAESRVFHLLGFAWIPAFAGMTTLVIGFWYLFGHWNLVIGI
jgi:hypothetical protein